MGDLDSAYEPVGRDAYWDRQVRRQVHRLEEKIRSMEAQLRAKDTARDLVKREHATRLQVLAAAVGCASDAPYSAILARANSLRQQAERAKEVDLELRDRLYQLAKALAPDGVHIVKDLDPVYLSDRLLALLNVSNSCTTVEAPVAQPPSGCKCGCIDTSGSLAEAGARDWTSGPDGRANSSALFKELTVDIARIIRDDASRLLAGQAVDTAALILAALVHRHRFEPRSYVFRLQMREILAHYRNQHAGGSAWGPTARQERIGLLSMIEELLELLDNGPKVAPATPIKTAAMEATEDHDCCL